jgi:hypothetical protein
VSSGRPPAVALACAYLGSASEIVGWTFKDTDRPCCRVQSMNPCGFGKNPVFQFQPFQLFGDLKSVSTTSQSSGVLLDRKVGSSEFWKSAALYGW